MFSKVIALALAALVASAAAATDDAPKVSVELAYESQWPGCAACMWKDHARIAIHRLL